MRVPIFFLSFVLPTCIFATTAELGFKQSSQTLSTSTSLYGNFKDSSENSEEVNPKLNWNLSYSIDKSNVVDSFGTSIIDNTQSMTVGLGAETTQHFSFELDNNYSVTPEEQMNAVGPSLSVGFRYYFQAPPDDFSPSVKISFGYGLTNNNQSFNTLLPARRKDLSPRPLNGNNIILQTLYSVSLTVSPLDWVSFKGYYAKYEYNRDVNQFLQFIESPRLAKVSNGIGNALSGFNIYNWKLESNFYLFKIWEFDLSHSVSKIATDSSYSTENDLIISVELGSWVLGAGVEFISSSVTDSSSTTTSLAKLTYNF